MTNAGHNYIVVAYIVMAYIVMAYMTNAGPPIRHPPAAPATIERCSATAASSSCTWEKKNSALSRVAKKKLENSRGADDAASVRLEGACNFFFFCPAVGDPRRPPDRRAPTPTLLPAALLSPRHHANTAGHHPLTPVGRAADADATVATTQHPTDPRAQARPRRLMMSTLPPPHRLYIGITDDCPLRGYGRAGTQNDRLGEAVILGTGTPTPAQWTCRRRCRDA